VKLAVQGIPSMRAHPIRKFFDAGVKVTINTDDTFFFGNVLEEEYLALHQELGFTQVELVQIARNGIDVALLTSEEKAPLYAELEAFAAETVR
jgi:adenosine deaminase